MNTIEQQRTNLQKLLEYATSPTPGHCNFGAMLLLSPPGDVVFLAPLAPELRGVEIVAATPPSPDGRDFDIWKKDKMIKFNLNASEVVVWLNTQASHSESDFKTHAKEWFEDLMRFYKIPKR